MHAYILMSFDPGQEKQAYEELTQMEEVVRVNIIYGEWDIIALVEAESLGALENLNAEKLRTLPGVKLTSTMIVAK